MPTHTTDTAPSATAASEHCVALHGDYAADLADLLGCLRELMDAEHDRLEPLLTKHDYDIIGLRAALDLHTALLRNGHDSSDDKPPF
jgi:hypothetical protein